VESVPIDWWTGKPSEGIFAPLDEFLKKLDEAKSADELIVSVNSVGGDIFAALAMRSRLSVGAEIQAHRGAMAMIHNARQFFYGYYETRDLERALNGLNGVSQNPADIYSEKTGINTCKILEIMDEETWLPVEEALKLGFIDEILEPVVMVGLEADGKAIVANKMRFVTAIFGEKALELPKIEKSERNDNELAIKSVDELKKAYPEFTTQMEAEAEKAGAKKERERLKAIYETPVMAASQVLINQAKYEEAAMNANELALEILKSRAIPNYYNLRRGELEKSGVQSIAASPNAGNFDGGKQVEIVGIASAIAAASGRVKGEKS
jgi:ClpP class serine protease